MVKGVAVKLVSYGETVPKLLKLIRFDKELKKHDKIILKPSLMPDFPEKSTRLEFLEVVLKFVVSHKNPGAEVFIVEGAEGADTVDVFDDLKITSLSEKYGVGLVDLNFSDVEEVFSDEFLKFDSLKFPKVLLDGFLITLPFLLSDSESSFSGSLSSMRGAFPAKHYQSFFSSRKNKLDKFAVKFQVHDILRCKFPDFTITDASDKGVLIAGRPLDMDKQAARALGLEWEKVDYLRLVDESFSKVLDEQEAQDSKGQMVR